MTSIFPLRGFALRSHDADPATHVARLAQALAVAQAHVRFPHSRIGPVEIPPALTVVDIEAALNRPEGQFGPLIYSLDRNGDASFLSFQFDRSHAPRRYPTLSFWLTNADCGLSTLDACLDLFSAMADAFGSALGGLFHPDQLRVSSHRRQAQPPAGIIPPPGATRARPPPQGLAPDDLEILSTSMLPLRFDRAMALESLWWASYIGASALSAWVEARADNLPFHARRALAQGTLFVATPEPPRLADPSGWPRLAELARGLELHAWQTAAAGR